MKAVWFNEFGKAREVLVYGELENITPAPGEVLIRLHASGVNPSDVKKRMGSAPSLLDQGFVIPNSDGAGIIEAVGEGIDPSRLGERVWTYNGQFGRRMGTSAEYISLPADQAVLLPKEASFAVGACMGIPAMTAHRCVMAGEGIEGQIVLVTGGAGRVGYYAIQWAKHAGATVIATAGSETSHQHCLDAGADYVVGHPSEESNARILAYTQGRKIDRVIEGDFGANLPHILAVLASSGTIATYASMTDPHPRLEFYKMMFMDITLRLVLVYAMPRQAKEAAANDITTLLQIHGLKHRIARKFPLKDSAEAHEAIEAGNQFGCVILEM
ncbi:MAG: NADPH:quinone reductase [Bacteroidota bacterium]